MNRNEAEKLLAAFIFGDLDEASKADLTAYLQTDDELSERLTDMRMAIKVASDALQHGPDPVLGNRRLKHLAKLAGRKSRKSAVFTVRYMAAAAAVLAVVILPSFLIFTPRLNNARESSSSVKEKYAARNRLDSIESGDGALKEVESFDHTRGNITEKPLDSKELFAKAPPADTKYYYSDGDGSIALNLPRPKPMFAGTPASKERPTVIGTPASKPKSKFAKTLKRTGERGARGGPIIDSKERASLHALDKFSGTREKPRSAPAGRPSVTTKPVPLLKQPPSLRKAAKKSRYADSNSSGPRLRAARGQMQGMAKKKTEARAVDLSEAARPLQLRAGNKNYANGRGLNADLYYSPEMSGSSFSKPSHASQDRIITDLMKKDQDSTGMPTNTLQEMEGRFMGGMGGYGRGEYAGGYGGGGYGGGGMGGYAGGGYGGGYGRGGYGGRYGPGTAPSISTRTTLDGDLDAITISPTKIDISRPNQPMKELKLPSSGDIPIRGPLFRRDSKERIAGAKGMQSINNEGIESIVSSGKTLAIGTEKWGEPEVVSKEQDHSKVVNSKAPDGEDESDLPMASRFKSVPVNPWVMTERDPLSTFALDVDTASYTLCRRYIHGGFLPPVGAVRMEEFVNYFNYHYPQRNDRAFMVHAEAAVSPFAGKGKNLTLLKVGVKARTIGRDQHKAAHLILVVDASASMGQPDRLGLVQQALNLLIDKLSAADRVTLITCANESRLHLEATSPRHRDRIRQAINAIQPSGPTNLLAGLKLGYATARRSFVAKQINHVVLCSDGVANVGQTEAEQVIKEVAADRKQGITITCVGVGYGSYNDAFLESLANQGDGSYVFLDSNRQAQRVFVEQLAATLHVVAKDARIQVSFNPDRVRRYRLIGYENRDIEDKRFRDDTVDAGEVGSGQCSTALYELELTDRRSADQAEELGTVFVRYRNAETHRMEEISRRLKSSIVQRRKVESSPRFFLAAAASRFAEILRQSEHVRHGSLTDVLAVAEKVSLALPLDRDVRELVELIRKAEHLPRAQ